VGWLNHADKNMHRVRNECMSVGNLARINDIWVNHHTLIAAVGVAPLGQ
jgi:hypothetical protein